jgi:hypothetical protein
MKLVSTMKFGDAAGPFGTFENTRLTQPGRTDDVLLARG